MRRHIIAALAIAALALPDAVAARGEDGALATRVAVLRLANEGMRVEAALALYRGRHPGAAPTVDALLADGALRTPPAGSAILRSGGPGAPWRISGDRGGGVEIPIAVGSLDGPECREAASAARTGLGPDGRFGCARAADGIVFRYAR